MIVQSTLKLGEPLSPQEAAKIAAEIESAKKSPITFDEDCPEMTDEQLKQFRRVNPPQNRAIQ